ncbi:aminoacyl-tRNA hydrolase [Bermanella marisrubri]|uniref:Peptidyl-tRNA hydrolase n=1 Tax=Bermanella marisrubri TaxID=207949 RepID=Q1N3M7_9GAMM|nr:aminoacyl-tRNA hydrolase [Bermanella marisrubri]EAT12847.1 peptidyl-tRNA hydrolase [Oceanobacter sp. RED65] [Bermanella marisrubri]QIZ83168.1 aminoacyl-tRNA hydrolase [Bermanella marisrubri]
MQDSIRLIVGLGNPGSEYENTRHNAGAWLLNEVARRYGVQLKPEKKFHGLCGKAQIKGQDVFLLFPTTFMNRSGQAVQALANFYKIPVNQILVVHDELDLPSGIARFKQGGGHGGQNGLKDIISKMANDKNFYRLRIGIGHPGDKTKVTGHVLGKPNKDEQNKIEAAIDAAADEIDSAVSGDWSGAMNRLHTFKA